ncbi:MAG: M6 family metalloprotease domain-containing protein [Dysgonamonadaceae bacterium]|nr:M6 family metalloprotease domain-containing protein [Dysgonamonadaceae bacterium]
MTFSAPAYPYFITVYQPEGQSLTVKMRGDERIKWMESEDGYSLLYDSCKNIVFAVLDEKGNMKPSNIKAFDINSRSEEVIAKLNKIQKGLQYSAEQKQILCQIRQIKRKTFARSGSFLRSGGTIRAICALIQFPDKSFSRTIEEFEQLLNQPDYSANGAKGSVHDFYLENSYGQLDLDITVAGIYTVAKNWKYYGENNEKGDDKHPEELAKEAAILTFNDFNPADYDNDGDGFIDAFHFIYAGYGEEAGGGADCIWAHEYGFPALNFAGYKKLDTYSCSPELRGNSGKNITHIGVICHELGHVLGAPDFYDTDGDSSNGEFSGTGLWDLMASGSWNASGASPAHINMYQKIQFGWVTPVELNSKKTVTGMKNSVLNPEAYIIRTSVSGEYFVLENRQKLGFDSNIPGHGLLIYHVSVSQNDIKNNELNTGHPQRVYPVYAASTIAAPTGTPDSYGQINSAKCTFPGSDSRNAFSNVSVPSMQTWNGQLVSKPLTDITEANGLVSFQFMKGLFNLTASVSGKKVTLHWTVPDVTEKIEGYNIYCNNKFLGKTSEITFRETVKDDGVYIYGVSVYYSNGNESQREEITVEVNTVSITPVINKPTLAYPNPVARGDDLIINSNYEEETALLFYSLSGQLITNVLITSPVDRYTVNLPQGIYLLKIINRHKTEMMKLIVK